MLGYGGFLFNQWKSVLICSTTTMTDNSDKTINLPDGMTWLASQVAGHHSDPLKNNIKMIKTIHGCVLKAGQKEDLQEREVSFYEKIKISNDSMYQELSTLTSKYYGTRELELGNERVQFIVLEDVTAGMPEPCVMDIKIGKRTWDPLASNSKRAAEEKKYVESKKAYGLCIPGFQVYDLSTRDLRKFSKDYGKQLNKETIIEALKIFLNAENCGDVHEILLTQLLTSLKKIEHFFNRQNKLRFYSSSILVAYDAHYLRELNNKKSSSSHKNFISDGATNSALTEYYPEEINWLRVKMIDFTHVFEAEDEQLDMNYFEGIMNLIKVLESFISR